MRTSAEALSEFDLIAHLQQAICLPADMHEAGCRVGIGDDSAVLNVPEGHEVLVCTDSLVDGVHFPSGTRPEAIGHKALAVNLSDLAAMGARPAYFFMALSLPAADPHWLASFARGVAGLARQCGIQLAGGDTTNGPLSITITALGYARQGQALLRSGARPGDKVVVSGFPGSAAQALKLMQGGGTPDPVDRAALEFPVPRIKLGKRLLGKASACIDLSDGLAADLKHVLKQSGVGARIELESLPCPAGMAGLAPEDRWLLQLAGGDDYELCFTLPPDRVPELDAIAKAGAVPLTVIGEIVRKRDLLFRRGDGSAYAPSSQGFRHFSTREEIAGAPGA